MTQDNISVIDPIGTAFNHMKLMLFKPFDIGKWFAIGFCAFLASLGQGGSSPNFNFSSGRQQGIGEFRETVINNLYWIIPVSLIAIVIAIAIGLAITWLSSRGKFMFLNCIALNRSDVRAPWEKYKTQANSLFLFRVALGLIGFFTLILAAVPIGIAGVIIARTATSSRLAMIGVIIIFSLFIACIGIVFAIVHKFTTDFVVPIMYLRGLRCVEAWRQFRALLSNNKGKFAVYILFQIVISMAIGIIAGIAILIACCCTCCMGILPYISTVILLPVLTFTRAYILKYFSQYGPEYNVFRTDEFIGELPAVTYES